MQKFLKNLFTAQRCRRAMFFLLFAAVMLLNSSPELRADALYLIADGDTVSVLDGTTDIPQERVIVAGAQSGDAEVTLPAGEKVTVTHGDDIEYATTRNGERVSELLRRLQISVSPLEMVLVDVTEEEVEITVASDFTYYETATEAAPHTTLTSTSYRIPKGETRVVQQGIDGTRDIVYEVVYADGQFVSRQAVEEKNDTSVAEITYTGTLVDKAQSGDTVKSVVTESDGSGYLLMKSGDSVHFSGSMKVTCTAYTAGYGGVGTRTATGTTVHVGTVADHGEIGGGSGQSVEVRSRVGSLGGIGIQRVSGVDLCNVGGTDVERDAGRAVDGGDQHSHILMARDIGGGSQGENAGQLDAQIVPVADLIADFDLDRSIGAGLAAAQQSGRAQSGGRSTGALEERTAGNFIGHGKCLLLLNADHETLF